MTETSGSKPIFRPLNADDPDPEATEVESLCMNCYAKVNYCLTCITLIHFFFLGYYTIVVD